LILALGRVVVLVADSGRISNDIKLRLGWGTGVLDQPGDDCSAERRYHDQHL
jgi:hypothetical protein